MLGRAMLAPTDFCHTEYTKKGYTPKQALAFAAVWSSTAWASISQSVPMYAATWTMLRLSLRVPRTGSGAM